MSDSCGPHGSQPARFLCPWDSPGKNTGVGCHFLLQGIFPTQESNLGLLHCKQILYQLSFDQMDLCWQSNISAFQYAIQIGHNFSKEQVDSFPLAPPGKPLSIHIYYCVFHIYNCINECVYVYMLAYVYTHINTDNSVKNCILCRCCSWSCATWQPCLGKSQTIALFKKRKTFFHLPKNAHFLCVDSWLISTAPALIFSISWGKLGRAGRSTSTLRYVAGTLLNNLTHMGNYYFLKRVGICICITDSPCCITETNTTLLINCVCAVCVLSRFSWVELFVTLWTVAAKLLCPWGSPGKNTGVDCHALLWGIFPIQGSEMNYTPTKNCSKRDVFQE